VYRGAVIVQLGAEQRVEITHRALVIGLVDGAGAPDSALDDAVVDGVLAAGPDLVGLRGFAAEQVGPAVAALRARTELPVAVEPRDPEGLRAALEAGAVLVHDPTGEARDGDLAAVRDAGATVVLGPAGSTSVEPAPRREHLRRCVEAARAAGLAPERIVVDDGLDRVGGHAALELLRSSAELAELGPAAVSLGGGVASAVGGDPVGAGIGAVVVAVMEGCRLVRTHDVRSARRAVDVTAALLGHTTGAGGAAA